MIYIYQEKQKTLKKGVVYMLKIIAAKSVNDYKALNYEVLNIKCLSMTEALAEIKRLKSLNPDKVFMVK
jgi:hypothetical protein